MNPSHIVLEVCLHCLGLLFMSFSVHVWSYFNYIMKKTLDTFEDSIIDPELWVICLHHYSVIQGQL